MAIRATALSFILGTRIPHIPQEVDEWWRAKHPGEGIPDDQVFTQPGHHRQEGPRHPRPGYLLPLSP